MIKENTKEQSRILLLTLGLDTDKKAIKHLGVKDLKSLFSQTGNLKCILLFTKSVLLKAFLEYSSFEDSKRTVDTFHETIIGKYGKARLFYSPRQEIDLSNKYLEFWEEKNCDINEKAISELRTTVFSSQNEHTSNGSSKEELFSPQNRFLESMSSFEAETRNKFNSFEEGFNFNGKTSGICKTDIKSGNLDFRNSKKSLNFNKKSSRIYSFDKDNKEQEIAVFKEQLKTKYLTYYDLRDNNWLSANKKNFVKKSKVVVVSNLAYVFSGASELFKLFSCFGIIKVIMFMNNTQKALVEYTSKESADDCINNINGLQFGPTVLHLSFSKYKQIDFNRKQINSHFAFNNEIVSFPPHMQRYETNKKISANPISPVVLMTTKWSDDLVPADIYYFIEKYSKPLSVKMANSKDHRKFIQLQFTFEDVNSAIYVIYKCHGQLVKDSRIFISFC